MAPVCPRVLDLCTASMLNLSTSLMTVVHCGVLSVDSLPRALRCGAADQYDDQLMDVTLTVDLAGRAVQFYQYNVLTSEMIERDPKQPTNGADEDTKMDGAESDEAFEVMGQPNGSKKRLVPVLTVYISSSPIKELKDYG